MRSTDAAEPQHPHIIPATVVDDTSARAARLIAVNAAGAFFQMSHPPAPGRIVTVLLFPPSVNARSVWARATVEWSAEQRTARVMSGFGARWMVMESSDVEALRFVLGRVVGTGLGRIEVVEAIAAGGQVCRFRPCELASALAIPEAPSPTVNSVPEEAAWVMLPAVVTSGAGARAATVLGLAPDRVWLATSAANWNDCETLAIETAFTTAGSLYPLRLIAQAEPQPPECPHAIACQIIEVDEQGRPGLFREYLSYLAAT